MLLPYIVIFRTSSHILSSAIADSRRVVRVFLASPGDLTDERRAAKSVAEEFNQLWAEQLGYQVELVGWEDTVSVYGRPQAVINRDLERCELFVGLLWKTWGTPPDTKGPYTSGFEEEFERSVTRRSSKGEPEISLFFKEIGPEFLSDPGDQLKKVLTFRDRLVAEKTILFESFVDSRDFEKRFRRCITAYISNLLARESSTLSDQSQAPTSNGENLQATDSTNAVSETPLSVEGAKFLREFILKTERSNAQETVEAVEVARFRLLTNLVRRQDNDERSLGPHDANLLFSRRSIFTFGRRELVELLSRGLDYYVHENVPVWHWLVALDGFGDRLLPFYSLIGPSKQRIGALKAMSLISEPLPSEISSQRAPYIRSWFRESTGNDIRVAALGYLAECGTISDLPIIRLEFDKGDSQTVNAAADAIIRINLRESREKGLRSLFELQPVSIDQAVLTSLFHNESALSTDILLQGVGHRNSDVRRTVVEILRKRSEVNNEIAVQLIEDSEAPVRYEGLKSLLESGRTISDNEAKAILIKYNSKKGFGIFGSLGIPDAVSQACWEDFQHQRLHTLKDKELKDAITRDPIFNRDAYFVLAERRFRQYGGDLRRSIDDQHKAWFIEGVRLLAGEADTSLKQKLAALEDDLRKAATRKGLDIICRRAQPSDLGRVRSTLKSGFVHYSDADMEYLRRFGEWEDVLLILDSLERPKPGTGGLLFSAMDETRYGVAARTVYELAKRRLAEVFAMPLPDRLLSYLVVQIPDKAFHSLDNATIIRLLQSQGDRVRKAAALKCARAIPKNRLVILLADYMSADQPHYYNVIHWLDFGVSAPKDRVIPATRKVFEKEWRI